MAGVKITDLGTLATAASDDLLYIVDVSTDTSKAIEVGNLLPVVDSGTWTPTFSGESSAVLLATLLSAKYLRVGEIVTCTIRGTVDVDFSTFTEGEFDFTFPIATSSDNAIGVVNFNLLNQCNAVVRNASIVLSSTDITFIDSSAAFFAIFQYEIN